MSNIKNVKLTSEISYRINELLSTLELSQSEFAKRIGVTKMAVSNWCRNVQKPSETTIREICRQFNVDYNWLTEGKFEMFLKAPKSKIEMLQRDYGLTTEESAYIMTFLQSDQTTRQSLILFNKQFINNLKELSQGN